MTQNRNKLIKLLIGNISNAVVHRILEKSITEQYISSKYNKELLNSMEIAKSYRKKINPVDKDLSEDIREEIKKSVISKVENEIDLRKSKGYKNLEKIDIEKEVEDTLLEIRI